MLQQATAFGPLMRESLAFAYIAWLASKHQIRGVVRTASTQGNDMLNVVGTATLTKWLSAVIAAMVLRFEHAFHIAGSIIASCLQFTSASPFFSSIMRSLSSRRLLIPSLILTSLCGVFLLPFCYPFINILFIAFIPFCAGIGISWLLWLLAFFTATLLLDFSCTRVTVIRQFISRGMEKTKVFMSGRKQLVALATAFFAVNISLAWLSVFFPAHLATWMQTIRALIVLIEKLKCSREWLLAENAAFLYSVHTAEAIPSVVRASERSHRSRGYHHFIPIIAQMSL